MIIPEQILGFFLKRGLPDSRERSSRQYQHQHLKRGCTWPGRVAHKKYSLITETGTFCARGHTHTHTPTHTQTHRPTHTHTLLHSFTFRDCLNGKITNRQALAATVAQTGLPEVVQSPGEVPPPRKGHLCILAAATSKAAEVVLGYPLGCEFFITHGVAFWILRKGLPWHPFSLPPIPTWGMGGEGSIPIWMPIHNLCDPRLSCAQLCQQGDRVDLAVAAVAAVGLRGVLVRILSWLPFSPSRKSFKSRLRSLANVGGFCCKPQESVT